MLKVSIVLFWIIVNLSVDLSIHSLDFWMVQSVFAIIYLLISEDNGLFDKFKY